MKNNIHTQTTYFPKTMKIYLLIAFIFIAFSFDVKGEDTIKQTKPEPKKDEVKQTKSEGETESPETQPNHVFNMIRLSIGVCICLAEAKASQDTSGLSKIKSYKDLATFTNKDVFQTALSSSEFIAKIKKIKLDTKLQEIADLIKTEANLLKYNNVPVNKEKLVRALDEYIQKINPSNNLSNKSDTLKNKDLFEMIKLSVSEVANNKIQEIKSSKNYTELNRAIAKDTQLASQDFINELKKSDSNSTLSKEAIKELILQHIDKLQYKKKAVYKSKIEKVLDEYIGKKESSTNYLFPISMLLIGLLVGAGVTFIVLRKQKNTMVEQKKEEDNTDNTWLKMIVYCVEKIMDKNLSIITNYEQLKVFVDNKDNEIEADKFISTLKEYENEQDPYKIRDSILHNLTELKYKGEKIKTDIKSLLNHFYLDTLLSKEQKKIKYLEQEVGALKRDLETLSNENDKLTKEINELKQKEFSKKSEPIHTPPYQDDVKTTTTPKITKYARYYSSDKIFELSDTQDEDVHYYELTMDKQDSNVAYFTIKAKDGNYQEIISSISLYLSDTCHFKEDSKQASESIYTSKPGKIEKVSVVWKLAEKANITYK